MNERDFLKKVSFFFKGEGDYFAILEFYSHFFLIKFFKRLSFILFEKKT